VLVHIDSPEPASLEVMTDDGGLRAVCSSPCDQRVPASEYRITGPGLRTSDPFRLDQGSRVTLHVSPSSPGTHTAGIVITIAGGVGLLPGAGVTAAWVGGELAGLIFVCPIVAAFASGPNQNAAYGNCLGDISTWVGRGYAQPGVWIPAIAGAVLLTTGIVLLASNPHSRVTQVTPATASQPSPFVPDLAPRAEAIRIPAPPVTRLLELRF
jgi:hypothetical protein